MENLYIYGESYGDSTQLLYLRARYYNPTEGRFTSRDTWSGDENRPMSHNLWAYAYANPIIYTDQSGYCSGKQDDPTNSDAECWSEIEFIESTYSNIDVIPKYWKTTELKAVEKSLLYMTNALGSINTFQFAFPNMMKLKRASWFYSLIRGKIEGESALGFSTITMLDDAFYNTDDYGSFVVIHEFGHFFDARFDYFSRHSFKDRFWENCTIDAYGGCKEPDAECKIGAVTGYAMESPYEDFAESFAGYVWISQNGNFSTVDGLIMFPMDERYQYMEAIINTIKNLPH